MSGNYEHFKHVDRSGLRDKLAWQSDALCAETNPEAFVPTKGGGTTEAKKVCARCDVGLQCLLHALAIREGDGVYGGMTVSQRRQLVNKSRDEVARAYKENDEKNKRL